MQKRSKNNGLFRPSTDSVNAILVAEVSDPGAGEGKKPFVALQRCFEPLRLKRQRPAQRPVLNAGAAITFRRREQIVR